MDVTKNSSTGLYTITLGGVLWNNCSTDADCPGAAVCALNQTWSEYPSMCHCTFTVQHEGADCLGVGPYGIAYFLINLSACIIALVWFAVALFDLFRLIKWNRFKRDALSTSLVLTVVALLMAAMQSAAVARFSFWNPPPDTKGLKDDHIPIGTVGMALTFLFTTMSMLNVSLVWIQIADNAEKVRKVTVHNVTRYRTLLIIYYIFFFGLMVLSLFLGSVTIAAGIAAPGILFVLFTYLYAGVRMRRMLSLYLSSGSNSGSMQRGSVTAIQESSKSIRESLQAIQYAALTVSFISLNFVVWVVTWLALGGYANRPGKDFNQIALSMDCFGAALAPSAVMWYLHHVIQKKGRTRLEGSNDRRIVAARDVTDKIPTGTIPAFTNQDDTTVHDDVSTKRTSLVPPDQTVDEPATPLPDVIPQDNMQSKTG